MSGVAVVTDSSTCLPAGLAESLHIRVLPISVHLPDGEFELDADDDGLSGLPEAVELEELRAANHPFVTEYLDAVEAPGHDAAVIVTPAVEFATMYRNAVLAAELARTPTVTIDARTAAAGQALVVLAGAEAAARGADLDEVVRVIEDASRRVELVASLATLGPLRRSGPVPDSLLGEELVGMRSVFRMRDGTVEAVEADGADDDGLGAIASAVAHSAPLGLERSTVFHAGVPELATCLADKLGGVDFVSGFSIAMQIHTGRGVVGAAWLPRPPR